MQPALRTISTVRFQLSTPQGELTHLPVLAPTMPCAAPGHGLRSFWNLVSRSMAKDPNWATRLAQGSLNEGLQL